MNIYSVNSFNHLNNTALKNLIQAPVPTAEPVDSLTFKAGKPPKKPDKVAEFFAKVYGKYVVNSDGLRKFSNKLYKMNCGDVTQHLQTLGSIITSGVYMKKTLTNESLDKDRRKTLAWNQGLVLGVSTLGAYTLSNWMGNMNKFLEYEYVAKQEAKLAKMAKVTAEDIEKSKIAREVFSKRLKGFRTLLPILTFTLIYRFISPVAITPIANVVSDKISANKKKKAEQEGASNSEQKTVKLDFESNAKSASDLKQVDAKTVKLDFKNTVEKQVKTAV